VWSKVIQKNSRSAGNPIRGGEGAKKASHGKTPGGEKTNQTDNKRRRGKRKGKSKKIGFGVKTTAVVPQEQGELEEAE